MTHQLVINQVHKHIPFFRIQWDNFCRMVERFAEHFIECANDVNLRYNRTEGERRNKKADELAKVYTQCLVDSDKARDLGFRRESEDWNIRAQHIQSEIQTLRSELPAPQEGCMLYKKIFGDEDEYDYMNIPFDLRLQQFWITQGPVNTLPWFLVTHERWKEMYSGSMSDEERLMYKCVILSVAHDEGGKLDSADERIYRHEPYQAQYFKRDEFCEVLWENLKDDQTRIEGAYDHVKPYLDAWRQQQETPKPVATATSSLTWCARIKRCLRHVLEKGWQIFTKSFWEAFFDQLRPK